MKFYLFTLIIITILFSSCGKGIVQVSNESYEPRIVVEGILLPHHQVSKIRITKNFPIDKNLNYYSLIFNPNRTDVTITDEQTGRIYPLELNIPEDNILENYYYEYNGSDLIIDYGKSYTLEVRTTDNGNELYTKSTTTIPEEGFYIQNINFDNLLYRARDENDDLINFQITINRSPGTTFYRTSVKSSDASTETFIYDNPFTEVDAQDVQDDINAYMYNYNWIMDTPETPGTSLFSLYWINFWFYGEYQIIVYAADKNYEYFLETYNDVMEDDGNFHEARFSFEGDGIGVFGSAIADTVYVTVSED